MTRSLTPRQAVSGAAVLAAAILIAGAGVRAQQTLTPEWIASEAGSSFAETPRTAWRGDGSLWIYDNRDRGRAAAFELLNPATGARRAAGDAAKALAALNAALPAADPIKTLPWPDAIDEAGAQGLYVLNGDVFRLDQVCALHRKPERRGCGARGRGSLCSESPRVAAATASRSR